MKLSTDRILTTHVGSLPRSGEVVELLYKKDSGEPYDQAAFDAAIAAGVSRRRRASKSPRAWTWSATARRARSAMSTYIKDRLSGFAGHHTRPPHLDLAPYPELREALGRMLGKQSFKRAGCVGADRPPRSQRDANGRGAICARRSRRTTAPPTRS